MPEELYGGIPERDMRAFMEEIYASIDDITGENGDGRMADCKIDLARFFDTIPPDVITSILERLGAPKQLVALLRRTAKEQIRWIDTEGYTHTHPIKAGRVVVAGCPTCMLQTAAIIPRWVEALRSRGPRREPSSTTEPFGQRGKRQPKAWRQQ